MSKTEFTPGPWINQKSASASNSYFIMSKAKGLDGVNRPCDVACVSMGGDEIEMAANAALITAAPEMYAVIEALEKAIHLWAKDEDNTVPDHTLDAFRKAQYILKKARGE
jgi:hypothetical protein